MDRVFARKFSMCGPCLTQGQVIGETAQFYSVREGYGWEAEIPSDRKVKRIKKDSVHVEPCPSCQDQGGGW